MCDKYQFESQKKSKNLKEYNVSKRCKRLTEFGILVIVFAETSLK